jgi:hypothetical protein
MVDSTAGAGILGNSQELFLPSTATHMMAVATYESPRMTNARLVPMIVAVALFMDNKGNDPKPLRLLRVSKAAFVLPGFSPRTLKPRNGVA